MKKLTFLSFFVLIFAGHLNAKKIEGIIIFEHDTAEVIFNIPIELLTQQPDYDKLQYRVAYFDAKGKKRVLSPYDALEIRFRFEQEEIRMLSRNGFHEFGFGFGKGGQIFLKLEVDGPLKLFTYYHTQPAPGTVTPTNARITGGYSYDAENAILQKGEDRLFRPMWLTFRKDMKEYLSDCPALIEMIENKEMRRADMVEIVGYYNEKCGGR